MGAIFIGAICALVGFGYIKLVTKAEEDGTLTIILVVICFFLGLMMTVIINIFFKKFIFSISWIGLLTSIYFYIVVTDAIDSGVSTTFVALAEDPDALRRTKPELFERIRRVWPQVVQGV
jgi:hypothetical protein